MLHVSPFQITQIVMIAVAFILHLMTFYNLTFLWGSNMVMFETTVYGTYFIIKLGYLLAVLTDGAFTPPLEAMTKLYGAVLYNVLGVLTIVAFSEAVMQHNNSYPPDAHLCLLKGFAALIIAILYYIEVFQA